MNFLTKPLATNTLVGFYSVWFSMISVMGVIHAINHTGLSSLWGWFTFGLGTLMVFYTHAGKLKIERMKRPMSNWGFRVLFAVVFVSHLVIITSMAEGW